MPEASFNAVVTTRTVPRCFQVSPGGIELSMVEMHWFWALGGVLIVGTRVEQAVGIVEGQRKCS